MDPDERYPDICHSGRPANVHVLIHKRHFSAFYEGIIACGSNCGSLNVSKPLASLNDQSQALRPTIPMEWIASIANKEAVTSI